jgi:hypothetical protein
LGFFFSFSEAGGKNGTRLQNISLAAQLPWILQPSSTVAYVSISQEAWLQSVSFFLFASSAKDGDAAPERYGW